jgi:hypothetical protein
MKTIDLRSVAMGIGVAGLSFVLLGTVSALWENPLFIRMTPVSGFETAFLAALSVLLGVYVAIRRPACSAASPLRRRASFDVLRTGADLCGRTRRRGGRARGRAGVVAPAGTTYVAGLGDLR